MKSILITGSSGFLGHNLLDLIKTRKINYRYDQYRFLIPTSQKLNLLDINSVSSYFQEEKITHIIHLGALCGGLGLNKKRPADLTHLNNKMTINLFDMVREHPIEYFLGIGSVCSYPKYCPIPFREEEMWSSKSEETNRGYGESKKMLITELQTHMEQYGTKGIVLVPTNMFGSYDHFGDLENNHVIPALIKKFVDAVNNNEKQVFCWGDGSATRDFVLCSDVCSAVLAAFDQEISSYEPVNIGSGQDISMHDLAYLIKELTGYQGEIVFTGEISNGQPKRLLDCSRARQVLKWEAMTSLRKGLIETIQWYKNS